MPLHRQLRRISKMAKSMNRHLKKPVFLILLVIAVILMIQPARISAHNGGEPRLVDVEAGDFRLSVWTLPVPLETGELNFIVFVAESSTEDENAFVRANTPVLDANIQLIIEPNDGGEPLVVKPDHERATNKLFYESYFDLVEEGNYTALVSVESGGRSGEAEFSFELAQGLIEINWFRYSGIAVLVVAVGWFIWQLQQDRLEDET